MKDFKIETVFSIGCGVIAQHIVSQCALHHCQVVVFVRNEEEKQTCIKGIRDLVLVSLIKKGLITPAQAEQAIARIRYIDDPADTPQDAQLVTESVLEDLQVKRDTWARFAPYLPKDAILTTNTSTMCTSQICDACGNPSHFLAWHFAAPVYVNNIADIMPHAGTDPCCVEIVEAFSRKLHLNPVILKRELGGYLANSLLSPVLETALEIYHNGYADFVDIDRSWMTVRLEQAGPFGIMDKIGLDTIVLAMKDGIAHSEILDCVREHIQRGELGVKSGKGFYSYPDPAFEQPGFVDRAKPLED